MSIETFSTANRIIHNGMAEVYNIHECIIVIHHGANPCIKFRTENSCQCLRFQIIKQLIASLVLGILSELFGDVHYSIGSRYVKTLSDFVLTDPSFRVFNVS